MNGLNEPREFSPTFPILMKWDMISARLLSDAAPRISFCTQKLT